MDKYEYKHLADQIQYLIDQKEYVEAAAIADKIDWRRVRSVMMLGTISDLYQKNCRYEDARDILLMAYERKPENRQICYSLCELYIKIGDMVEAVEFYKEYAQLSPKDAGQYILQYKMYEATDVSLEERAEVLENLKKVEYLEPWMYELAYLYHRMGLETKCVEACDELILWFGSGTYVNKALELKVLHAPLTPQQQEKYENRFQPEENYEAEGYEADGYEAQNQSSEDSENRQLSENSGDGYGNGTSEDYLSAGEGYEGEYSVASEKTAISENSDLEMTREYPRQGVLEEAAAEEVTGGTRVFDVDEVRRQLNDQRLLENEQDNLVKIVDVGQYNTMNLQAEIAAGVNAVLGNVPNSDTRDMSRREQPVPMMDPETGYFDGAQFEESRRGAGAAQEIPYEEDQYEEGQYEEEQYAENRFRKDRFEDDRFGYTENGNGIVEESEVYFSETGDLRSAQAEMYGSDDSENGYEEDYSNGADAYQEENAGSYTAPQQEADDYHDYAERPYHEEDSIANQVMEQMRRESLAAQEKLEKEAMTAQPPEKMAKVLTQESDGQIRLVMPESKTLEKQITGQISIEDIRAEWERMKQESKEKHEEEVRQQVIRHTGQMFTEYEAALRDNILKQMEEKKELSDYDDLPDPVPQETEEHPAEDYTAEDGDGETDWDMESIGQGEFEFTFEEIGEKGLEAQQEEQAEDENESEVGFDSLTDDSDAEADGQDAEESVKEESQTEAETGAEEAPQEEAETDAEEAPQEEAETEAEEAPQEEAETEAEEAPQEEAETEAEEAPQEEAETEAEEAPQEEAETEAEEAPQEEAETEAEEAPQEEAETEAEEAPQEEAETEAEEAPQAEAETDAEEAQQAEKDELYEKALAAAMQEGSWDETDEDAMSDEKGGQADSAKPAEESDAASQEKSGKEKAPNVREMTEEEAEHFGELIQGRSAREQIVKVLDGISMAAYTGNVIVTGDEERTILKIAKKIIREVKNTDSNLSGAAAVIDSEKLNGKSVAKLLEQLKNGALIIEGAADLSDKTVKDLYKCLQQDSYGIVIMLLDAKREMERFLKKHKPFEALFTNRFDLAPLSNDALAEYGQEYAREQEYSIDDLGMLALHTRIDEMQTADYSVTKADVEEIVDYAIDSAARKTLGHFIDILLGRRYDDEDMIIVSEKDFM